MGFIRGALITITTILLFMSLFSTASFLTISRSLDFNVIQPEIKNIINDVFLEKIGLSDEIENLVLTMQIHCDTSGEINFEYNTDDYNVQIPCVVIEQGSEQVINYFVDDLVEKNYYKEYDCDFVDCFGQQDDLFFIFSNSTKAYFNHWFYVFFLISLVLAGLLFFFIENKNSFPFLFGIILVVVSLPFLGAGRLVSLIVGWEYAQIFGAFFSQAYLIFLIFVLLGVISVSIGIILKFLYVGRFIGGLFNKKDNKITKENLKENIKEVVKEEKKENLKESIKEVVKEEKKENLKESIKEVVKEEKKENKKSKKK